MSIGIGDKNQGSAWEYRGIQWLMTITACELNNKCEESSRCQPSIAIPRTTNIQQQNQRHHNSSGPRLGCATRFRAWSASCTYSPRTCRRKTKNGLFTNLCSQKWFHITSLCSFLELPFTNANLKFMYFSFCVPGLLYIYVGMSINSGMYFLYSQAETVCSAKGWAPAGYNKRLAQPG